MDAIFVFVAMIGGIALFDALAARFGVDSRPSVGDDYTRPMGR